jgi:iron complex transport system permease protein
MARRANALAARPTAIADWERRRQRQFRLALAVGGALLLLVGFASLMLGAVVLSPADAIGGLASDADQFARLVVWEIRVPRFLDAMLVGAALGTAGALLQVVTRNPLADPTILGISAAAGLAVAVVLVTSANPSDGMLSLGGVAGGLIGAGAILFVAWGGAVSPLRLTLAGVAMAALFGAAIVGLLASSRTFLEINLGFLAGGLYGAEWPEVRAIAPWIIPGLVGAQLASGRLNALALGDEVAASLGVLTDRTRVLVLALAGVLTGTAVSVAGLVSFVGLVSPHLARFAVGSDQRYLLPASMLTGALLVATADLVARLVIRPAELPMGILTAAIGAPFLLYLLRFRTL